MKCYGVGRKTVTKTANIPHTKYFSLSPIISYVLYHIVPFTALIMCSNIYVAVGVLKGMH